MTQWGGVGCSLSLVTASISVRWQLCLWLLRDESTGYELQGSIMLFINQSACYLHSVWCAFTHLIIPPHPSADFNKRIGTLKGTLWSFWPLLMLWRWEILNVLSITGRNEPLKKDRPKWKSDYPMTEGQLRSKRDEFWDTAPAFEGRKEIWDALKAAAVALECNDHELAQAIVDGASITLPHGENRKYTKTYVF